MRDSMQRGLFERTLVIQGKHAKIHKELLNTGLFSNNHEIAEFAMMIGILYEKTEKKDLEGDLEYKIQKETMRDSGETIIGLYRFCMILHDKFIPQEARLERAFNYDDKGEEALQYEEILESYMRGGYMILDEKILQAGPHSRSRMTDLDFIQNEYDLLNEIDEKVAARLASEKNNKPLSSSEIISFA